MPSKILLENYIHRQDQQNHYLNVIVCDDAALSQWRFYGFLKNNDINALYALATVSAGSDSEKNSFIINYLLRSKGLRKLGLSLK